MLQLRAQRRALKLAAAPQELRTEISRTSVAPDGVPPSPTAFRLEEERRRLQYLQQLSLEKLTDVRALALQKAELQAAAHSFLFRTRAASSAAPQSRLRATAPPFTVSPTVAPGSNVQESLLSSTESGDNNTLTYVGSFRPEEYDATGAVWPFDVKSTVTLELSCAADKTLPTADATVWAGSALGFVLTRCDRISRKQQSLVDMGGGEHVATREWSGDCSLVLHHVENPSNSMTIEIDATFRARNRRNYHKPPPFASCTSRDGGDAEVMTTRHRHQHQHQHQHQQQLRDRGDEKPSVHDETLKEPLVRSGRIIATGHKFVVWGWGGNETVTLSSTSTQR